MLGEGDQQRFVGVPCSTPLAGVLPPTPVLPLPWGLTKPGFFFCCGWSHIQLWEQGCSRTRLPWRWGIWPFPTVMLLGGPGPPQFCGAGAGWAACRMLMHPLPGDAVPEWKTRGTLEG